MEHQKNILGKTQSVCPVCLERIFAERVQVDQEIYLEKVCPEHGDFRTILWRGEPSYQSWSVAKEPSRPPVCAASVKKGCPFDCGLCPDHRQHTCCVLLEVTNRCNLQCPICFAKACTEDPDPDLKIIESWYDVLLSSGGPYNIQLSGGEPTVRDDLPEIIALGRRMGFTYIQLNTNGLRLANDPHYVKALKKAGLSCVFLQFDGTKEGIYKKIRGRELFGEKERAIANCTKEELGVVLVPTLVPEINVENIGEIITYGIKHMPTVRGVHFQPISYFGRYPQEPRDADRITIPEVIREMVRQMGGKFSMADFKPPTGENAYCSFHGNFLVMDDGVVKPWTKSSSKGCCQPLVASVGAKKAQAFVAKRWVMPKGAEGKREDGGSCEGLNLDSLDLFLAEAGKKSFCISGMAFQDVWSLDLERLQECFIHVVSPDSRIIPFCAYNLTNKEGEALYRIRKV